MKKTTTHDSLAIMLVTVYTLCPKKVVHQTHGDNFCQFLTDFHNSFTGGKPSKFAKKTHIILPSIPSVCCRTALQKKYEIVVI